MNANKDFTIDKVAWHTQTPGNPESPASVKHRFMVVVDFLQRHKLAARLLLNPGQEPGDDFAIRRADLTDEGFAVLKNGYDKWLKEVVNRNKDLSDVTILERALAQVRKSSDKKKEKGTS